MAAVCLWWHAELRRLRRSECRANWSRSGPSWVGSYVPYTTLTTTVPTPTCLITTDWQVSSPGAVLPLFLVAYYILLSTIIQSYIKLDICQCTLKMMCRGMVCVFSHPFCPFPFSFFLTFFPLAFSALWSGLSDPAKAFGGVLLAHQQRE